MDIEIRHISHPAEPRDIVIAAVQLGEPELTPVTARSTFEWEPNSREARIEEVRGILSVLCAGDAYKKPDVIVFPEYSIPFEAHRQIEFQKIADEHRCIIVAGSYFQSESEKNFFRNNLCKIYLPDEKDPLLICKALPSPEERKFLLTSDKLKNIARLVWSSAGTEPVSISIFLCRDYLAPFREPKAPPQHDGAVADSQRVSLLDWDCEGLNIVVMNNKEPAVFEGTAALDVRETHGKRKLVLLVNSSNDKGKLATAMLGATSDKERERDIAAKFPPSERGVLVVETRLWDLGMTRTDPDTSIEVPIRHWENFRLLNSGDWKLAATSKKEVGEPAQRGIFHPAFLAALQKQIVIEMLVAKSTQNIEQAFASDKIRYVNAGHVRGVEDVSILRYADKNDNDDAGQVPSLSRPYPRALPFCYLDPDEFSNAFDFDRPAPSLRVLIDPRNILKFRGVPVPKLTDKAWLDLARNIGDILAREENIKEIVSFATDLSSGRSIPEKYRIVFSLGIEPFIPVGRESMNRETYLFIAGVGIGGTPAEERLRTFIENELLPNPHVRDIAEINLCNVHPPITHMPRSFQFVLRLKCTVFDADDVLSKIQSWAGANHVRVGTRSYDVWRNLKTSATAGIVETSMDASELHLMKDLLPIDPQGIIGRGEVRKAYATAVEKHSRMLKETPRMRDNVKHFLHCVCLYNFEPFESHVEKRSRLAKSAADSWTQLFMALETYSHLLLAKALGFSSDTTRRAIVLELEKRFPDKFREEARTSDAGYLSWYKDFHPRLVKDASDLHKEVARHYHDISSLRNFGGHGGTTKELESMITVAGKGWRGAFSRLDSKVGVLCKLIVDFEAELRSRGLSP